MNTYTAVAYCPHTGMALKQGDKSFYLSPEGELKEMFKMFPESAVLKHHYIEIKPMESTVENLVSLMHRLDQKMDQQ
jgi:hypothetical protein